MLKALKGSGLELLGNESPQWSTTASQMCTRKSPPSPPPRGVASGHIHLSTHMSVSEYVFDGGFQMDSSFSISFSGSRRHIVSTPTPS